VKRNSRRESLARRASIRYYHEFLICAGSFVRKLRREPERTSPYSFRPDRLILGRRKSPHPLGLRRLPGLTASGPEPGQSWAETEKVLLTIIRPVTWFLPPHKYKGGSAKIEIVSMKGVFPQRPGRYRAVMSSLCIRNNYAPGALASSKQENRELDFMVRSGSFTKEESL
jgi:hypothetical protein